MKIVSNVVFPRFGQETSPAEPAFQPCRPEDLKVDRSWAKQPKVNGAYSKALYHQPMCDPDFISRIKSVLDGLPAFTLQSINRFQKELLMLNQLDDFKRNNTTREERVEYAQKLSDKEYPAGLGVGGSYSYNEGTILIPRYRRHWRAGENGPWYKLVDQIKLPKWFHAHNILHEIGHAIIHSISGNDHSFWSELKASFHADSERYQQNAEKTGPIYAFTNAVEGFCEVFAACTNPYRIPSQVNQFNLYRTKDALQHLPNMYRLMTTRILPWLCPKEVKKPIASPPEKQEAQAINALEQVA